MTSSTKADWLIPAGLIALSVIPVVAGTFRIVQLGSGAEITPDNAGFFAVPLPVVLHIISTVIYCVLGAFQFSPRFRRRKCGGCVRIGLRFGRLGHAPQERRAMGKY